MIRVPRLKQNRHGVYSIRILWTDAAGQRRESLHSLGTRHATTARLLALAFNEAYERKRAMTEKPKLPNLEELVRKYELDMAHGVMKADGAADHALMMEALKAYKEIHGQFPPIQEAMTIGRPQTQAMVQRILAKSMPFSQATAAYLEEKQHDNAPQTLVEKGRTYKDFTDVFGDLDINLYGKPELVQWKTADLKRGIKANRINKRLGQVNDFFNWAIRHGPYTASDKKPRGRFVHCQQGQTGRQGGALRAVHQRRIEGDFFQRLPGGHAQARSLLDSYRLSVHGRTA